MSEIRRTLSPREWLNRCLSAYGELAILPSLDGLPDNNKELLKFLGERAESFDSLLGSREGSEIDPTDVRKCRTVLGSLKKFRDPVDDVSMTELESAALAKYKANNLEAKANTVPERFVPYMKEFLSSQLADFDWYASGMSGITPRFGNGGVDEQVDVLQRWEAVADQRWFDFRDPLDVAVRPGTSYDVRFVTERHYTLDDRPYDITRQIREVWTEHVGSMRTACRLCAVPKDWNKRRLITIEPYALTYLQQTVRTCILASLASSQCGDLRALAAAEFGVFDPQSRHRRMALQGSMDGSLATLDLSDASDHVSWTQVVQVFPADVLAQLERARSDSFVDVRSARLSPSDSGTREGPVYMFAGMGNACTFVIETLMFHAACYAVAKYHRLKCPWRISVFGDDIVCATELAELLVQTNAFEEFGWKINWAKSFYTHESRFRESCGVQAFRGVDVTLLRYMGGFDKGPNGLVGLCALLERIEELGLNDLTFLTGPWQECQGIPNLWCRCASGIYTHVRWWPETAAACGVTRSWSKNLQSSGVNLLHPRVRRTFVPTRRLGAVYGAIAGQLRQKTAVQGRRVKRAGVWIDSSEVDGVIDRWTPIIDTEP